VCGGLEVKVARRVAVIDCKSWRSGAGRDSSVICCEEDGDCDGGRDSGT
jgi:hypothetical protein